METWRAVVGHEGLYEVSDQGGVRSLDRAIRQAAQGGRKYARRMKGKLIKPVISGGGYLGVEIVGRTHHVHRLVAAAFIGPCPAGQETRHRDGNRFNCRADNLLYGTHSENMQDAIRHGTRPGPAKVFV